jgi:hypothetical protein
MKPRFAKTHPAAVRFAEGFLGDFVQICFSLGETDRLFEGFRELGALRAEGEKHIGDIQAFTRWWFDRYLPAWNRHFGAFVRLCPACGGRFKPQGSGRDVYCSDACSARVRNKKDERQRRHMRKCKRCGAGKSCATLDALLGDTRPRSSDALARVSPSRVSVDIADAMRTRRSNGRKPPAD